MTEAINLTMAMLLVGIGSALALALLEPRFMRRICARGLGWAQSFEEFKKNRIEETAYYERKLGISERGPQLVREEREA